MCMYVAHWNIFIVNKCDLQKEKEKKSHVDCTHNSSRLFFCSTFRTKFDMKMKKITWRI